MTQYLLLNNQDEVVRTHDFAEGEEVPDLAPAKGLRWVLPGAAPVPTIAAQLSTAKSAKVQQIIGWVNAANQGAFPYAGRLFGYEPSNAQQIAVVMAHVTKHGVFPASWLGGWKDINRVPLQMATVDVFLEFHTAMVNQGFANFLAGEYLQAMVEQATTLEQVDAVVW